MSTKKYTTVAEVAQAIGANAYGLKLLKYLSEHFPEDALDYDLIMGQAKLAAEAAERYVLDHGTTPRHQIAAEEHAYKVLLGVYADAYSKYDDLFRVCDDLLYDAGVELEAEEVKAVAIRLMPKFNSVFEKYPIDSADFTATVEYDRLMDDLKKEAKKLLNKSEIEKIKEASELPF